jgi:hypothetical protein
MSCPVGKWGFQPPNPRDLATGRVAPDDAVEGFTNAAVDCVS